MIEVLRTSNFVCLYRDSIADRIKTQFKNNLCIFIVSTLNAQHILSTSMQSLYTYGWTYIASSDTHNHTPNTDNANWVGIDFKQIISSSFETEILCPGIWNNYYYCIINMWKFVFLGTGACSNGKEGASAILLNSVYSKMFLFCPHLKNEKKMALYLLVAYETPQF